ncbi:MAG TPA: hypothetical protein VKB40_04700 [Candidatus Acidoferrales bacterium]|nr:hypothetical protein [Candidatus Acidoferrales bacterium]
MFIERKACKRLDLIRSHVLSSTPHKPQESLVEVPLGNRVLPAAGRFLAGFWMPLLAISALILVPCFWHRHIEAGDLGSHVYSAWLAQLIEHGQAPGLRIKYPSTNILFDSLLSGLARMFGLYAAERISVAIAVLIFFWGAFALVAAATKRAPCFLAPAIAMVAYGWTFEMGFFNYYISLGLSFFALAILWRGTLWECTVAIVLIPFIYVAHPLGVPWLMAAAAYVRVASLISPRVQLLLAAAAAATLYMVSLYLSRHFVVGAAFDPSQLFNGGDQLVLFGDRYKIVEALCGIFVAAALAIDVIARRRERNFWHAYLIPLELYVIAEFAVFLLPDGVRAQGQPAALALITERLTSISAVLACCVLGAMLPRKWHLIALATIALVFFVFLYQDTARINRMEAEVAALVKTLPPDQRVLATILKPDESRVLMQHIVDRECIGHCFSYGNYEPASTLFRIHALPGNSYAMTDFEDVASMEAGDYQVQPEDLPAYQIYQCSEDWTKLCIRPLAVGELNDRLGVHPQN